MDLNEHFESQLNGYFDVEKDEEGHYTDIDTHNMYASYMAGVKSQQVRVVDLMAQIATLTAERDILKPDALCDSGCIYQCTDAYTVKAKCLCSK